MSDSFTIEVDAGGVEAAINRLGEVAQPFVNAASAVTAGAMATEMRARLQRQLGPDATGKTVAGIVAKPAYDGNGYVVIAEREPFPNLPLWLEKGTKKGKPGSHTQPAKPYFYSSALLFVGAHQDRIALALQAAIDAQGLGD